MVRIKEKLPQKPEERAYTKTRSRSESFSDLGLPATKKRYKKPNSGTPEGSVDEKPPSKPRKEDLRRKKATGDESTASELRSSVDDAMEIESGDSSSTGKKRKSSDTQKEGDQQQSPKKQRLDPAPPQKAKVQRTESQKLIRKIEKIQASLKDPGFPKGGVGEKEEVRRTRSNLEIVDVNLFDLPDIGIRSKKKQEADREKEAKEKEVREAKERKEAKFKKEAKEAKVKKESSSKDGKSSILIPSPKSSPKKETKDSKKEAKENKKAAKKEFMAAIPPLSPLHKTRSKQNLEINLFELPELPKTKKLRRIPMKIDGEEEGDGGAIGGDGADSVDGEKGEEDKDTEMKNDSDEDSISTASLTTSQEMLGSKKAGKKGSTKVEKSDREEEMNNEDLLTLKAQLMRAKSNQIKAEEELKKVREEHQQLLSSIDAPTSPRKPPKVNLAKSLSSVSQENGSPKKSQKPNLKGRKKFGSKELETELKSSKEIKKTPTKKESNLKRSRTNSDSDGPPNKKQKNSSPKKGALKKSTSKSMDVDDSKDAESSTSNDTPKKKKSSSSSSSSDSSSSSSGSDDREGKASSNRASSSKTPLGHGGKLLSCCHHCRRKKDTFVRCTACPKLYCTGCLDKHYAEKDTDINRSTWTCLFCRETCICSICRTKKAKAKRTRSRAASEAAAASQSDSGSPERKKQKIEHVKDGTASQENGQSSQGPTPFIPEPASDENAAGEGVDQAKPTPTSPKKTNNTKKRKSKTTSKT